MSRSDKDLTDALRQLTEQVQAQSREKMAPRGAAAPAESAALFVGQTKAGGGEGGGIASPLVERAYADRLFHTEVTLTSTDSLFRIRIKPVSKILMLDANGAEVELQFKAPT